MNYEDFVAEGDGSLLCAVLFLAFLAGKIGDDFLRFQLELFLEVYCMDVLFLIR